MSYENLPCLLVLELAQQEVAASLNCVLLTNLTLLTRAALGTYLRVLTDEGLIYLQMDKSNNCSRIIRMNERNILCMFCHCDIEYRGRRLNFEVKVKCQFQILASTLSQARRNEEIIDIKKACRFMKFS